MADSKITALTDGGDLQAGDEFVIARAGGNKKIADTKFGIVTICDQLLSGAQATFDTNTILGGNIPSVYKHLFAIMQGRGDASALAVNLRAILNNDTGANYYRETVNSSGASVAAGEALAAANIFIGNIAAATATAGRAGSHQILIPNYAGTTFHKDLIASGFYSFGTPTGDQVLWEAGGVWANTAAITRLALSLSSGNFAAGSRFTLYGLR